MKNLLPTTLPVHVGQYHQAGSAAGNIIRQTENLLIAVDLITHPWDDIFLRSSLRDISRSLWEEAILTWSYTQNLTHTVNDIHRSTATTINFNPLKFMTSIQNVVYNLNLLRDSYMSFINVTHQLRYMSPMNMNILHREIDRLGQYITTWQSCMHTLSATHSTYLQSVGTVIAGNSRDHENVLTTIQQKEQQQSKRYEVTIDHVFTHKQSQQVNDTTLEQSVLDHVAYESPREYQSKNDKDTSKKPTTSQASDSKNYLDITTHDHENGKERQGQIINMVRNRGVVSINDIAEHFPILSRKTLQRDLSELIDQGKIIRSGDKRWALYRV